MGLKPKAGVLVVPSLFAEPWICREFHCDLSRCPRGSCSLTTVCPLGGIWHPFVVFDGCQPWTLTYAEASESAAAALILFHQSDIPLPLMSAQSCWWVIAERNFYYIHYSSIFHCATASIKTSDLKMCSDGLNKSNQDVNASICLPGFLLFFSSPGFSALNLFSPACLSMSFLFAVFGLMSPLSASDVTQSRCSEETTLSSPTCLAGSLIVLSIQVWKFWSGGVGSAGDRHTCVWNTTELQKSSYNDQI